MHTTLSNATADSHLLSSENRPRLAKAAVRKPEIWVLLGGCMDEVRRVCGLSLEQFAYSLGGRDDRQIARQIKGEERPQIEVLLEVPAYRGPFVVALSRIVPEIDVVTEIRVRRIA